MGMESPETAHKADDSCRGSTAVGCVQTRRIGGFFFWLGRFLLVGLELNHYSAVIERWTGARQTFSRRPAGSGDLELAWGLSNHAGERFT